MTGSAGPNGLTGSGDFAYLDGQIPSWYVIGISGRFVPTTFTRAVITGGTAGALTVSGILTTDILLAVIDLTSEADLTSEFSITATDTIDNSGGTNTTGDNLLVLWLHRVIPT